MGGALDQPQKHQSGAYGNSTPGRQFYLHSIQKEKGDPAVYCAPCVRDGTSARRERENDTHRAQGGDIRHMRVPVKPVSRSSWGNLTGSWRETGQ